jgi:hypothetical protein
LNNLRYKTSAQIVAPWKIDDRTLAARLLTKEPSLLSLFILFVGLGAIGYVSCRFRWWIRELYWPISRPRLAPYADATFLAASYVLILAALALPILGAVRNKRFGKAGAFSSWKWLLPFVQIALCVLSIWFTPVQHRIYMERLQIEADVRAGGEHRGAADLPWNYKPLVGSDVVTVVSFPVTALFF